MVVFFRVKPTPFDHGISARAQADIFLSPPIFEIMPALRPVKRPITHLVALVSRFARLADLYEVFHAAARDAGYERYEVSHWALDGAERRHNLKNWRGGGYVGMGGGHSSLAQGRSV